MSIELLSKKYQDDSLGILNCYDRIFNKGHVYKWCFAEVMTSYLYQHDIRIFDYPK